MCTDVGVRAVGGERNSALAELDMYLPFEESSSSTDYQIIKCNEYSLIGELLPYNPTEPHTTDQSLRCHINALQQKIK